jgi:hypothetical protein
LSGGNSLPAGFADGSAIDDPAGRGAGRRRERGFHRGKLKGGSRAGGRGGWDGGAVRRTGGEPVGCASGERGPRRRGGGVCDGRTAGSGTADGVSAGSARLLFHQRQTSGGGWNVMAILRGGRPSIIYSDVTAKP